ncbi:pentapeptide repeat-containing protein [Synechococcus sp. 8F6]|uniref:pentapeptide repeat-containing protein n=1 Tax=Synechococcus sp. 8F6 TaxID=2025606 RepID=UPI00130339DD|nr:pentapeptide repeat-containing protein [Synechococcus sp. 8F6]
MRGAILLGHQHGPDPPIAVMPRQQRSARRPQPDGPRPQNWAQRQQRRHDSRLFRLLDGSFAFRLALSAGSALALLLVVNSYATCRNQNWSQGCLFRDAEALISVGNVESLSIVTAAFLYLLEGHKRRQRENMEAYDLLQTCNAFGARWLMGRIHALESLNSAGLSLAGQQLAGFDLHNLQAPHGDWQEVNLENSVLRQANLAGSDLRGANLRGCDLQDANLRGANLRDANLDGADLTGAQLEGAELSGTHLEAASTHPA